MNSSLQDVNRLRRVCAAIALTAGLVPVAHAGVFLTETAGRVMHPSNYNGAGGEVVVNVCLDPALPPVAGNATQATANAVAEFNRFEGALGNVVNALSVGAAGVDYQSILMHEMGHCLGLDHNVLGPSEVGCSLGGTCPGSPSLFFTNALEGTNGVINPDDGADNQRGTGDDLRGDDVSRHWHRNNANNPFETPAVVDRTTHSQGGALGGGDTFPEAVTSFSPCIQGPVTSNTSAANGQPPTSDVMFPVLCTNNVVRDLSPNDRNTFRIARAGLDGVAGNADDYTVRLNFQGTNLTGCNVRIRFPSGGGFFCGVSFNVLGNGDLRIIDGTINLQRETGWFFNQVDTTGTAPQPCLFRSGFENTPVVCEP